jgi:hypothetical protein
VVGAHKNALPDDDDQFGAFPTAHRPAIFAALSPQQKSSLFQEDIRRFGEGRRLTDAQRLALDGASALLVPAVYSEPERYRADLHGLADRIRKEFGALQDAIPSSFG